MNIWNTAINNIDIDKITRRQEKYLLDKKKKILDKSAQKYEKNKKQNEQKIQTVPGCCPSCGQPLNGKPRALSRRWTKKEDEILLAALMEGRSKNEIAVKLNRRKSSIYSRILTLAGKTRITP